MGGGLQEDVQHNDFIAMSVFHAKHLLYVHGSYNLEKVLNFSSSLEKSLNSV